MSTAEKISVLCVDRETNYKQIPGLDLWDADRDAYLFTGTNPVIVHPPCQQWSMLKAFAHDRPKEKELAWFCLEKVKRNGGILEHPAGSSFFAAAGIKPTISVDQIWWGFPARKRTYLYFVGCRPLSFPLSFDLPKTTVQNMDKKKRSRMTVAFCQWLVDCIKTLEKG